MNKIDAKEESAQEWKSRFDAVCVSLRDADHKVNTLGAQIIRMDEDVKELQLENERNEKRWDKEKQELKDEIDVLIMKIAMLENTL